MPQAEEYKPGNLVVGKKPWCKFLRQLKSQDFLKSQTSQLVSGSIVAT